MFFFVVFTPFTRGILPSSPSVLAPKNILTVTLDWRIPFAGKGPVPRFGATGGWHPTPRGIPAHSPPSKVRVLRLIAERWAAGGGGSLPVVTPTPSSVLGEG